MTTSLYYFAYGSNMASARLQARTPSASFVCLATLHSHALRFHKQSHDGSAKCDAHATDDPRDRVIGTVFMLQSDEKPALDKVEGLGQGYDIKTVNVITAEQDSIRAFTYYATLINPDLQPYHWYKHHVLTGALEHGLPHDYIQTIETTTSIDDPDMQRALTEMSIYCS